MRLTVRVLGFPVFEVELAEDETGEFEAYQDAGSISSERIEAGPTDRYMGFTLGLEGDE